jgi:glycerophosphoryl diester phosphodiesterase
MGKIMIYRRLLFFILFGCVAVRTASAQADEINVLKFRNVQDTKDYFHYTGKDLPVISGHRGGAMQGFPENCIHTFVHTLKGTTAIFEVDPHLTKDSAMVLLHDDVLDRVTTGHGKLNAYTLAQVEKLQLKDPEGNITSFHLNTLSQAIQWCRGKTMLNLDVKDVPLQMKAEMVKKYDAFNYVMFTVHSAKEAKFFYDFDHRSLFSAFVKTKDALLTYEAAGIPWSSVLLAYVGSVSTKDNQELYDMLHKRGVMVMVGAAPSYDTLKTPAERAAAYRKILQDGVDIIESDRPLEVAAAIKSLYPGQSVKYRFWKKEMYKNKNFK